jgi:hypothetical protein
MVTSYSYGPRASRPTHGWERATPVALMGCVIHKEAQLELRAPSKDEKAGPEAAGAYECAESGKTMIRSERDAANVLTA